MKGSSDRVERWAWYSLGINVILILINLSVAIASGSLAVGAETAHNVVDFLSAVGVLAVVKLASRKTERFPYGLYKLENIASIAIAGLIFITGYEIARRAFLGDTGVPVATWWMYLALCSAIAIPVVFSFFQLKAGRESNSPAIKADAREFRIHGMTTSLALIALMTRDLDLPVDRIAALFIVVAIVNAGWQLLKEGLPALLDASLESGQIERLRRIIESHPTVEKARSVIGRSAGRYHFVQALVVFRISDLERVEKASTEIEQKVRRQMPDVEQVVIHPHPDRSDRLTFAVPLESDQSTISESFGKASSFALFEVRIKNPEIEKERIVANPHRRRERRRGILVSEWLVRQGIDVVLLACEFQAIGAGYVLHDAGVYYHCVNRRTLEEIREEFPRLVREQPWGDSEDTPPGLL